MKYWSPHTLIFDGLSKSFFSGVFTLLAFSAIAIFLRSFTTNGVGAVFDSGPALITVGVIGAFSAVLAVPFRSKVVEDSTTWHNIGCYYKTILAIFALTAAVEAGIFILCAALLSDGPLNIITRNTNLTEFQAVFSFSLACGVIATWISYTYTIHNADIDTLEKMNVSEKVLFVLYATVSGLMTSLLLI